MDDPAMDDHPTDEDSAEAPSDGEAGEIHAGRPAESDAEEEEGASERPEPTAGREVRDVDRPQTDGAPMVEEPGQAPEDPDRPEAFGRWLRSQRELRGIRLRAIAESSKIGLGHLRALESGRFDLLPADVFTKGFLRQYAGYVGLDPEEAINFYLAAREHVEEEEVDPLLVETPPREASGARWVVVALLLAAVLLGIIWGLSRLAEESSGTDSPTDGAAATAPASRDAPAGSGEGPNEGATPDSETGAETGSNPATRPDSSAQGAASGAEDVVAADGAGPIPSPAEDAAQPADVPLRVVLDFSDTCWVSAVIDDGETREKVHAQGESLTLDARRAVDLKVGNFRAVDVEVNGMPYDLASRGRVGSVVRTVRIDLESLRSEGTAE